MRTQGWFGYLRGGATHGVAVADVAAAARQALDVQVPGPGQDPNRALDYSEECALFAMPLLGFHFLILDLQIKDG